MDRVAESSIATESIRQAEELPRWADRLAGSEGVALAFVWGVAEGTLFFVVPDVLLSLIVVIAWRRAWRHIVAAIAGAVFAGALMYSWADKSPTTSLAAVKRVPFVTKEMFTQVEASIERRGMAAVYIGPLSGIPYKIFAVQAPRHFGAIAFLLATVPARGWRFILVSVIAGAAAAWLRVRRKKTTRQLAAMHLAAWTLFYAFYWTRIVMS